ncbi:hypothetical protein BGZ49_007152 [Haplosporangium sp. Z 27]|nr:hypothetical protein BGZ49_007152 [Haplosporangium sp. Z 27]
MLKLMQDFKATRSRQDQDENSLSDHIDMGVYSKNRGIRCLGSCKRNDMGRYFIRSPWHQSSMHALDAEFFITNVRPESTRVNNIPAISKQTISTRCAIALSPIHEPVAMQEQPYIANRVSLLQQVFDAVHNIYTEFETTLADMLEEPTYVGRNARGRLEFTNYKDIDGCLIACDKILVQAESQYRLDLDFYEENVILILDEFSSVC